MASLATAAGTGTGATGGGAGGGAGAADAAGYDANKFSRQVAVYGQETMAKIITMNVLVIGLKGLGVCAAKNLVLIGPKSVTLYDPEPATTRDLGTNFFLRPADVEAKRSRADACVGALRDMNPSVAINVLEEKTLSADVISRFSVVLCMDRSMPEASTINAWCRAKTPSIPFIAGAVVGAAGWGFSDFGDTWGINDGTGEPCRTGIISDIGNGSPASVLVLENTLHGLMEGDWVAINEVKGMTDINGGATGKAYKVIKTSKLGFDIDVDTTKMGEYAGGGVFEQVKMPTTHSFKSMAARIENPLCSTVAGGIIVPDWGAMDRPLQLHVFYQGLYAFEAANKRMPRPHDAADAAEVVRLAHEWNANQKKSGNEDAWSMDDAEIQDSLMTRLARVAAAEMQPLCAFYGGVLAQEAVKQTGKYTPLDGWLYMDASGALPDAVLEPAEVALDDAAPSRYDHQITFFGRTFVQRLQSLKVFLVGAGALGCEYMKAFALLGIGAGKGMVTVTDMDTIELSNLTRQFLFRAKDIGKPKSATAAAAAVAMNPDFKVDAMSDAVGHDTEGLFDDKFWDDKDLVVNALDNLKARLYVDSKCLWHQKPLLEAGTLGTKANSQVVAPHKTCAYGDSVDPPEDSIPMCTLRNFPHKIEHCIEWARDKFSSQFNTPVADAARFTTDRKDFLKGCMAEENMAVRRERLVSVVDLLEVAKNPTYETCVRKARFLFNDLFNANIRQLLHNFPLDHINSHGVPFWSGSKRAPKPLDFNANDDGHLEFITSTANILAFNMHVPVPSDYTEQARKIAASIEVPAFVPRNVRIKADENDKTEEGSEDDTSACQKAAGVLVRLPLEQLKTTSLTPAEFEKDDDTNFHVAFITACANLRARNYSIKEASHQQAKVIAGKIIPAIATTTAMITGLTCIELYKIVAGAPLERLRDGFVNLAINMVSIVEPKPPRQTKSTDYDPTLRGPLRAIPEGFTSWDKLVVQAAGMSMEEVVEHIQDEYHVEISMVSCGPSLLFAPMMFASHRTRATKSVREVFNLVAETPLPDSKHYVVLDVSAEDEEGVDVVMPPFQVIID